MYPSLCLDLLVNPTAFAVVVASITFPSFLPSRRLRDDEHETRCTD
jgi:hypothetical protein